MPHGCVLFVRLGDWAERGQGWCIKDVIIFVIKDERKVVSQFISLLLRGCVSFSLSIDKKFHNIIFYKF